jgi:outer membrane protein assembly factor BamA
MMHAAPRLSHLISLAAIATIAVSAAGQADSAKAAPAKSSPWLLAPVFNVNPKLGTSLGAIGGYIHYFDAKSRPSMFFITGQYTSTSSIVTGLFARTSSSEDHDRIIAGFLYGKIKNDYDDYLGTGMPLKNTAQLYSLIARYTRRVVGDWFVGAQGMKQNFEIAGESEFDDQVLDLLGLESYKSAGLGLVVQYDSRNNESSPLSGSFLNLNNMAFRENLGGDNNYDVYRVEFRYYIPHGDSSTVALRTLNHLTSGAPTAARAPVMLRGYKIGEYTGEFMSSIEAEERWRFARKFTATLFAGVACLYGDVGNCSDGANLYPNGGVGIQYIMKPKEGIVMNLEYAAGKSGNQGIYLKMGYAY